MQRLPEIILVSWKLIILSNEIRLFQRKVRPFSEIVRYSNRMQKNVLTFKTRYVFFKFSVGTLCITVNYALYVSDIKLHNIMPNSISPPFSGNFILYEKLHWKPRKILLRSVFVAWWVFSLNSFKKSWILWLKHQTQSQLAETPIAPKMVIWTQYTKCWSS